MHNYQLLLFDVDDTLFDYNITEEISLKNTLEQINVPYVSEYISIYRKISNDLWNIRKKYSSYKDMRIDRVSRFLDAIGITGVNYELFIDMYIDFSKHGILIEGVHKVLNILHEKYILVANTNGSFHTVRKSPHSSTIPLSFPKLTTLRRIVLSVS